MSGDTGTIEAKLHASFPIGSSWSVIGEVLAPWSLAREAGIESATVDGTIEIPQYVQPVLDTGFVDEKG